MSASSMDLGDVVTNKKQQFDSEQFEGALIRRQSNSPLGLIFKEMLGAVIRITFDDRTSLTGTLTAVIDNQNSTWIVMGKFEKSDQCERHPIINMAEVRKFEFFYHPDDEELKMPSLLTKIHDDSISVLGNE